MLALGVGNGSKVYLVTRCGDVVELGLIRDKHGWKLGIEGKARVWRGEQKRAPGEASTLEDTLAEHYGVEAEQVEVLAIDFAERFVELDVPDEFGETEVTFGELWPCPKTGEPCEQACELGQCYLEKRGGRHA